jgi:hypothetical protein
MINPILYAGVKIDNVLMKGVDYSIKGYNWATGGTKADLANGLLCVLPGSFIIEGIQNSNPLLALLSISIGISNYRISSSNKTQEKLEKAAKDKNCKDRRVEITKKINKFSGYASFGLAGYVKANTSPQHSPDCYMPVGFFAQGLSSHIMSSDENPKKRDHCLKRAKQYIDNLKREPAYVHKNDLESLI